MNETEWLRCDDPQKMLKHLGGKASDRQLRLFVVACCRRLLPSVPAARWEMQGADEFVAVLERHAYGQIAAAEWDETLGRVLRQRDEIYHATCDLLPADFCTILCAIGNTPTEGAAWASLNANIALSNFPRRPELHEAGGTAEARAQAALLREIIGNPFRPVAVKPSWRTPAVVAVARGIYEDQRFQDLPILADAVEEAGCTNGELLGHLRGSVAHLRGCWAVDHFLANE
ncbi:MAG TPA: hypothetical protein VEL76_09950 [Gemmataceae bacterium]|nr:hypothetical protein [Gemmataceae bacterium]